MTKTIALLSLLLTAAPAFPLDKFPVRSQLMGMAGGDMPAVTAIEQAGPKDTEPNRWMNCTMDVDFKITGKGFLVFKVWGEYDAAATVTCDKGGSARYTINGEGPSVGLQVPGRGNLFRSVIRGKSYGLNLRLPIEGTPKKLEGEYFGGGVSTALGGVMLSPFTNENGDFEVKLQLPTGLKDDQGTLISVDLQHLTMRLVP